MSIIGNRKTFDGKRVSLFEDANGLSVIDGTGRPVSRAKLNANGWIALFHEVEVLKYNELNSAAKRAAAAIRKGRDIRSAIHAPAQRRERARLRAIAKNPGSLAEHVRRGCRRLHCPVCG